MEGKEIFFLRLFISIYTPRNPETRTDLMRWRVSARNFLQLQKKFQKDLFSSFQVTAWLWSFCRFATHTPLAPFKSLIGANIPGESWRYWWMNSTAVPLSTSEEKIWEISYLLSFCLFIRKLRNSTRKTKI